MVQPSSHSLSQTGNPQGRFRLLFPNPHKSRTSDCSGPAVPPVIPNRSRGIPAQPSPAQPREFPVPASPSGPGPGLGLDPSTGPYPRSTPGVCQGTQGQFQEGKAHQEFSGTVWQKIPVHSTNPRPSRGMFLFQERGNIYRSRKFSFKFH